jgi:uncharacterized membrane protein
MKEFIFYILLLLLFITTIFLVLQLLSIALKNKRIFSYKSDKRLKGKESLLPTILFLTTFVCALLYLIVR